MTDLQKLLSVKYYYPDKDAKNNDVDGIFGVETENAVRRFHTMHGLIVEGIAGVDDYYYVVDNSGNLKKFKDIKINNEPLETGINLWDAIGIVGRISYLFKSEQDFTFFVTTKNGELDVAHIFHSAGINETPTEVYKSNIPTDANWSVFLELRLISTVFLLTY